MRIPGALGLLLLPAILHGAADRPDIATLKKQHDRLSATDRNLSGYHSKLAGIKNEIVSVKYRAENENITNFIKVFVRGALEVAGQISAPSGLSSAYELLADSWNNLVVEPHLWTSPAQTKRIQVDVLKKDIAALKNGNRKLFQYCNELIVILKSPLPRFEDDSDPFPATAAFWRNPDGKPDDETELITRKLTVIKGFTGIIIQKLDAEMNSTREKRNTIAAELRSLSAAIASAQPPNDARPAADTTRPVRKFEYIDDRDTDGGRYRYGGPLEDRQPTAEEMRERQRQKDERELAMKKEQERLKKLEASARIIIDRDSPTRLKTGEYGHYLAVVEPPLETHTAIQWFIDDRLVTTRERDNVSVMSTVFPRPGTYTVRAVLKIRGAEHDQHLVNVKVDSPEKPAKYPPEMEGKTTPALNLDCCRYDTLYREGKIYITGFYYTPARQKIPYTSLPVENFSPQAPAAGMILTRTAGYHIYQTDPDGDDNGAVYVITRMRGPEVKVLHRLRVRRFSMDVAKDYSRITVKYQTDATLNTDRWETITLD